MRSNAPLALILVIVILSAATACSSGEPGTPSPSTPSEQPPETEPTTDQADHEAPAVEEELDVDPFLADPCGALNQSQLRTFDITEPGTPETTGSVAEQVGPFCAWHSAAGGTIGIGFVTGNENGLSDLYRGRAQFEDFRPAKLGSYPAVFANSPDLRSSGVCSVYVGTSNSLAFRSTEQGALDSQGSCDRAMQVAAAALETIRRGSR